MCVEKPRRFRSKITWPSVVQRGLDIGEYSWRLMAPRESPPAGFLAAEVDRADRRQRPVQHPPRHVTNATGPVAARCQLSNDGVAEPSTSGIPSAAARATATSRAW